MAYVQPSLPLPGSFEGRFEREGDNWLYRHTPRAAAIRITDAERKVLIDSHARWLDRALMVFMFGGMAVVAFSLLVWRRPSLPWMPWACGAAVLVTALAAYSWRFEANSKALFSDRPPAAAPRSRREASRLVLARTSWGRVGWGLLLPWFWIGLYAWQIPTRRFAIAVTVVWALSFIVTAVTAIRKLRLDRAARI